MEFSDNFHINLKKNLDYIPCFYDALKSDDLFRILLEEIKWKSEKIKLFGKEMNQPRLTAWYGEEKAIYTYSGLRMTPLKWHPVLLKIRTDLEAHTGEAFNSVLLNLYRSGEDYMGWHSDNEKELGSNPFIASLSLGETRKFQLKHKVSGETESIELTPGSLLLMKGDLQENWKHRIVPSKKVNQSRINLTYRLIR